MSFEAEEAQSEHAQQNGTHEKDSTKMNGVAKAVEELAIA